MVNASQVVAIITLIQIGHLYPNFWNQKSALVRYYNIIPHHFYKHKERQIKTMNYSESKNTFNNYR